MDLVTATTHQPDSPLFSCQLTQTGPHLKLEFVQQLNSYLCVRVSLYCLRHLIRVDRIALALRKRYKKTTRGWFAVMVGRAGFEPATNWLKANCSTD